MISEALRTPLWGFPAIIWLTLGGCLILLLYQLFSRDKLLVQLPGPPPGNWMSGHFAHLFGLNGVQYHEHLAKTYGMTAKIQGPFGEEIIWTMDPGALHSVLVKERPNFERPEGSSLLMGSAFGGGLLALSGDAHRTQRKMPIFADIAEQTCDGIRKELHQPSSPSKEVNVFPWMAIAALELVGEAGLGYSFGSFTGQRNEYHIAAKNVMRAFVKLNPFVSLLPFFYRLGTPAFRRWAVGYIPIRDVQTPRSAVAVQNKQAEEVIRARQALISSGEELSSQAGRGRDILTLLMKANEVEGSENYITEEEMIGHMNTFMFAGHETTSTMVSRILSLLADMPEVQFRLREELGLYFEQHKSSIDNDELLELPYLDAIVRESLRLYGPVVQSDRFNNKDTVIPLEHPVQTPNGEITSIPIKKCTRVVMSFAMANRHESIWGEKANEFWPERWMSRKLEEVTEPGAQLPGVYSSVMSFGGGATSCIGFKFAVMEIKVMVAALVKSFKFEPSQQEPSQWEAVGTQLPFLKSEQNNPERVPKLLLRVTEI